MLCTISCDEFVLNVILYLYTVLIELIFVYSCYRVIEILWLEIMLSKTNLTFGFTFIYCVELLESSLHILYGIYKETDSKKFPHK